MLTSAVGYSFLCRRQKNLAVQTPYRRTECPLTLLLDSTGTKFAAEGGGRPVAKKCCASKMPRHLCRDIPHHTHR
ncbi:transposase [Phaeobacter italicus]|uniref:transposase n=1 Tax=Phaeobacter italicus TaxID=481446 RepID=UPI003CC83C8A